MTSPPRGNDVWTAQGSLSGDGGWLLGGVFTSLDSACEYAERWARERPGLEVHVFRLQLDPQWSAATSYDDPVPIFRAPPGVFAP